MGETNLEKAFRLYFQKRREENEKEMDAIERFRLGIDINNLRSYIIFEIMGAL
jgi:hypothetical protein